MSLRFYENENGIKVYTLKEKSPEGLLTKSAHPAHFSPHDKYSRERVITKIRFGLQQTPIYVPDFQKLFVGNLSSKATEKDVRDFFKGEGDIWGVWFPEDGAEFCYVKFATRRLVEKAFNKERQNKKILDQEVWLNMKDECEDDRKDFEVHVVSEEDVPVDINNIDQLQNNLRDKYKSCGTVIDVFVPKYAIQDNKGFNAKEALTKALDLNPIPSYLQTIHVPCYFHNPSEIKSGGGYGGLYGYQNEDGNFAYEDYKYRRGSAHLKFDEEGNEIPVEHQPMLLQ